MILRNRLLCALVGAPLALAGACEAITGGEPPPKPPPPSWVVSRPFPEIRSLNDVEVFAFDEERVTGAYAVGTDGALLRYDGARWIDESIPALGEDLESVSVSVANNGEGAPVQTVLAVGSGGTVLQRLDVDGEGRWGILPSPTTEHLFGVWVRSADDAFIVGDGVICRFDGVVVTQLVDEVLINTGDVDENGEPIVFAISDALKGVQGRGSDDVWTVAGRGVVYHFDGATFSRDDSQTNRPLADVFTESGIWAAATDGVLLRRRDDGWKDDEFVLPAPIFVQGIWTRGDGDVFAVGFSEDVFHNENGVWDLTFVEEQSELRAIDGAELPRPEDAPEDFVTLREVIAVGAGGRIVRGPLVDANAGETHLKTRLADIVEE